MQFCVVIRSRGPVEFAYQRFISVLVALKKK